MRDSLLGIIPFETPPHIEAVLDSIELYRLIEILKARQIYMTWLMAGIALHIAEFRKGAHVVLISRSEVAASEILDYSEFIHSQLPDFLKLRKGHDQASLIDFPDNYSKIRAVSTTSKAGIGLGGATLIIADEFEFHEFAEENYAEIKPMIDRGGQLIILSAIDKYDQDTKFKQIWARATEDNPCESPGRGKAWVAKGVGTNNFHPIFIPYDVLPERDEKWYEEKKKEYDIWEMEGRYPLTPQEALSAPQLVCRFDVLALADLRMRCTSPLREELNGLIKIYQEPIAGGRYCFVIDPSEGTQSSDPTAGMIIDKWAMKVAEFHGRVPLDEQAGVAYDLYKRYFSPFMAVERNASGLTLIEKLKDLGVTNWYFCAPNKEGWWTSSATRPPMIMDLAAAVLERAFNEPNPAALDEFHSFIRTKKKQEGEARKGAHDEYPMMWAIALQARKTMPTGTGGRFESWIRPDNIY